MRLFSFLLCLLLGSSVFAQNTNGDPINFSRLSGMNLSNALNFLTESYGVAFSYNPEAVEKITVPQISDSVETVDAFLRKSLRNTSIDYEVVSNTYVLFPEKEKVENLTSIRRNFSISGVVRDKNTTESLPYASIDIIGTKISTTSNTDGKFTILNVPADTLKVSIRYLGYIPLVKNLYDLKAGDVMLCEMMARQRNLPSVEVSAQSQELIEILSEASQLSFNPSQISHLSNLGENDIFSALRRLPGIRGGLDASSGLKIRGGNSDENLVLFDGITIYHVDHFYGFLSAFNTNMIKNIQIEKGGYRAKYGGRTSGIVNITGIDGNKVNPGLIAEINTLSANIRAELPIVPGKASLVFAYRRSITDIIQSSTYKRMFNNIFNSSIPAMDDNNFDVFNTANEPDFSYSDLNAKVNFKPSEKDAISLSYYSGNDDTKILFDGSFENLKRTSLDNTHWGTKGGSLKWSRKWNKRLFTYANYGISRYKSDLQAEESYYFSQSDNLLSQVFFKQRNEVNDNTLRIDNTWEIDQKTRLEFGYWNSHYSVNFQAQNQVEVLLDSLTEANLHAGYAEAYRSFGKLDLSLGLRTSYYTNTDQFFWEPRFSFKYPVNKMISLKGAYGIYHQIIRRLNERSLYLSIPETWTLSGGTTIPVLKSTHYILGALFQLGNWQLDVEGYQKYESGTVDYLFPEFGFATGNLSQYAIGGNRKINGADILMKRSFTHQNIIVGYSFIKSETKYPGVNGAQYFPSPGNTQHELNFIYNYEWKRWDFSAAFVIGSGEPYTPVLGTYLITLPNGDELQYVSLGGINSKNLDWYNRLDLGVSYTWPINKGILQAGASVYNVYNKLGVKYIDYFEIPEEESGHYALGQRNILSLGFTPSLFLKLKI